MSYNLEVNVIVTLLVSLVFSQEPYIKRYQITSWSDARVSTNFWPCGIFSIKTTDPLSSVHLFLPFLFFWVIKPLCLSAHLFMLKLLFQFSSPLISLIHPPTPPLSIPLSLSLLYCPGAHGGLLQQIILHNNMEGLHNKLHLFTAVKGAAIKIVVSLPSVMRAQLTAPWTFWKRALMREFVYSVPLCVTGALQIVCLQLCDEANTSPKDFAVSCRPDCATLWNEDPEIRCTLSQNVLQNNIWENA